MSGCVTGRRADALFKLADKFYYGRYNGGDGGREASRLGMHPFLSELLRNFKDDYQFKTERLRSTRATTRSSRLCYRP